VGRRGSRFRRPEFGRELRKQKAEIAVVVDDADTFGRRLDGLIDDARNSLGKVFLILGMRSARVDHVIRDWRPDSKQTFEVNVPLLEDGDIERLIEVLDKDNKLGVLKPLAHEERVERIRGEFGRELLVAMIEATTDERFEVKVAEEYDALPPEQRLMYAIVAIATDLRHFLHRDEILMAAGDVSNTGLYALDRLAARHLLTLDQGRYRVRHRRIAELVVSRLRRQVTMIEPYRGLLRSMATRYDPSQGRSRETRLRSR
jgi:hypothetical protein